MAEMETGADVQVSPGSHPGETVDGTPPFTLPSSHVRAVSSMTYHGSRRRNQRTTRPQAYQAAAPTTSTTATRKCTSTKRSLCACGGIPFFENAGQRVAPSSRKWYSFCSVSLTSDFFRTTPAGPLRAEHFKTRTRPDSNEAARAISRRKLHRAVCEIKPRNPLFFLPYQPT